MITLTNRISNMSVLEYMEWIASLQHPSDLMLRSDDCLKYMIIADSIEFLKKWLAFQFDDRLRNVFVTSIYYWLARKDFKRVGMDIVGHPNCGKSYVFNALTGLKIIIIFKGE